MREFVIFISLFIVIALYLYYSIKVKNWVNILTPGIFIAIPSQYLSEILYLQYNDPINSLSAYAYLYFCYTIQYAIYIIFISKIKYINNKIFYVYKIQYSPYILLFLSILIYAPILYEYKDYIFSPRYIYENTRSGYGIYYFTSSFLSNLAFIFILFKVKCFRGTKIIFFIACCLLSYLHGSKGQILSYIFIWLLYSVYIKETIYSLKKSLALGILASIGLVVLFKIFSNIEDGEFLKFLSNYADYSRNSMLVIDSNIGPMGGALTVEENLYSRIPRPIYLNKPKNFGTFYLDEYFYPESFIADQGYPAFGNIGLAYADFGIFTIFYVAILALINGIITKFLLIKVSNTKSISSFILIVFISEISLIPLGSGYLLPEHLIVAYLVAVFIKSWRVK